MTASPSGTGTSSAPRPRPWWRPLLEVIPYAIGGGVVGALAVQAGERFGGGMPSLHLSTTQSALLLMVSCMALIGTIVVHELGHLLGGRLVGFRALNAARAGGASR
ncbi:MAG: hypothetical protein MUD17_13125 [Gemmatimonadaceae bacterium]|nr:hypothetical protein [Gemmatimonadaceae bacterium]